MNRFTAAVRISARDGGRSGSAVVESWSLPIIRAMCSISGTRTARLEAFQVFSALGMVGHGRPQHGRIAIVVRRQRMGAQGVGEHAGPRCERRLALGETIAHRLRQLPGEPLIETS